MLKSRHKTSIISITFCLFSLLDLFLTSRFRNELGLFTLSHPEMVQWLQCCTSCKATAMKSRKLLESCSCFHSFNQVPAFRRAHGSDEVLAAGFICSAKKHLHCFLLLGIGRVNSHRSSGCILFRRAVLSLVSVLLIDSVNISM